MDEDIEPDSKSIEPPSVESVPDSIVICFVLPWNLSFETI